VKNEGQKSLCEIYWELVADDWLHILGRQERETEALEGENCGGGPL
jgi:hypothetical protein